MTEQQITADTGLSKVTVRRYLNYLIGRSEAESQVDYSTGGRPRVEYRSCIALFLWRPRFFLI